VYVPVTLCNSNKGRLFIQPTGVVSVQAKAGAFANAQCFTSLEGASFALSTAGFTALTLQNGWINAPFATRDAAVTNISGMIRFGGAMATGGNDGIAFTLPVGFRPATNVYVPVDLCSAAKGRLVIQPTGVVTVQAEAGAFSSAQCFTSLEGASFALSPASFTPMTLQNGWTNAPFGTRNAAAITTAGGVRLQGAIATSGTNAIAFTLPVGFRPAKNVRVEVDLCGAAQGGLVISPTGTVVVQDEGGALSSAQCFTSLEGVSFAN
jgi:hypothetical protein